MLYGVVEESESETGHSVTDSVFSVSSDITANLGNISNGEETKLHSKMASGSSGDTVGIVGKGSQQACDKLDSILAVVSDIKKSQDGMQKMFESKLDKLRTDLMQNIDVKIRALRDEFTISLAQSENRIDQVMTTIQSLKGRLDTLEKPQYNTDPRANNGPTNGTSQYRHVNPNPLSDPDLCVVASGISATDGEDLTQKAEQLIKALGDDVSTNVLVTGAVRLPTRLPHKPGLVKIGFQNVHEKILVLRRKGALKNSPEYRNVYVKSCKSHAERLIELNARAILRNIPGGYNLRVDANGRIKARQDQSQD